MSMAISFASPAWGRPNAVRRTANNAGRRFKSKHHRTRAGRGRSARRAQALAQQLRFLHSTGRPKRFAPNKGAQEKIDHSHPIQSGTGRRCAAAARSIVKAIIVRLGMEEWLAPRTAEWLIRRWKLEAA